MESTWNVNNVFVWYFCVITIKDIRYFGNRLLAPGMQFYSYTAESH